MFNSIENFALKVKDFVNLSSSEIIDYFIYYHEEVYKTGVKSKDIEDYFNTLRIPKYSNISSFLASNSKKSKNKKMIKLIKNGNLYFLTKQRKDEIKQNIIFDTTQLQVNNNLRELLNIITNNSEKDFLEEAIKTFEVEAYRAAVIMVWLLTLDHLFEYILSIKLSDFNVELAKVTDRRVKVSIITSKDDFSDIPEGKFIEICRAARIISNDVRKILDEKLGIRNSCAHPSNINIGKGKVFEFIEDLVNNVILKY